METRGQLAGWRSLPAKIAVTLVALLVYRIGATIPAPGVDPNALVILDHATKHGGVLGLLNLLSGGALGNLSVCAVGVSAAVVAQMLVQLLGRLIPQFHAGADSELGKQQRVNQIQRYLTLVVGMTSGVGLLTYLHHGQLVGTGLSPVPDVSFWMSALLVVSWAFGGLVVMWLGELIDQRGVGSGIGVLVLASVLAGIPGQLQTAWAVAGVDRFTAMVAVVVIAMVGVTIVDQGQLRLRVVYARSGSDTVRDKSYLPLKINRAGVLPAIYAMTLTALPPALAKVLPTSGPLGAVRRFMATSLSTAGSAGYIVLVFLLILGFSLAFNAATFDADDVAENLARNGGYVAGIAPGPDTANYLERLVHQTGATGAALVAVAALVPSVVASLLGIPAFPITGTTVLILAVVGIDTVIRLRGELSIELYRRKARLPGESLFR
jgi:preprotein translocase subunit SecY